MWSSRNIINLRNPVYCFSLVVPSAIRKLDIEGKGFLSPFGLVTRCCALLCSIIFKIVISENITAESGDQMIENKVCTDVTNSLSAD